MRFTVIYEYVNIRTCFKCVCIGTYIYIYVCDICAFPRSETCREMQDDKMAWILAFCELGMGLFVYIYIVASPRSHATVSPDCQGITCEPPLLAHGSSSATTLQ